MKNENAGADTIDYTPPTLWPHSGMFDPQVDVAGLSHQGLVRSNNEDHFLIVQFGRFLDALMTNLPEKLVPSHSRERGYGLVVADGVGGAAGGEVASRLAIARLIYLVLHTPDWNLGEGDRDVETVLERMAERFRHLDATLRGQAEADFRLHGMGTTMTLACSIGATLIVGHIGDSRAYLYRNGVLHQLTRDHTLVQSLVELGRLTPEEAAKHPYRHLLTRMIGSGHYASDADFQRSLLIDGDQLLLSTDGLTEMVSDAAIAEILAHASSAAEACEQLVDTALKNGGKDNVTVTLARYRFGEDDEAPAR
jgi:protein phosphatase